MTTAYIITNPLRLYSEKGFFSSTSEAKQLRPISLSELARSIPTDPQITIYTDEETARKALPPGASFQQVAPLILQIELEEDSQLDPTKTQRTIDLRLIKRGSIVKPVETRDQMENIPTCFLFRDLRDRMKLPFSRALNPTSKDSGILFWGKDEGREDQEIFDFSVSYKIKEAFRENSGFLQGLKATFDILVGDHYPDGPHTGSKGVLDFLIFPLLARRFINDTQRTEWNERHFINALAWTAAIPLEIMRFTAGIALTLLLAPIVAIVTLIRPALPLMVAAVTQIKEAMERAGGEEGPTIWQWNNGL